MLKEYFYMQFKFFFFDNFQSLVKCLNARELEKNVLNIKGMY